MLKEHKKMYKAGKKWMVMALTSFAVMGSFADVAGNTVPSFMQTMTASADPNGTGSTVNSPAVDLPIAGGTVHFDSIEAAHVGKMMNLPQENAVMTAPDGETFDFQVRNVFVYLDDDGNLYAQMFGAGESHFYFTIHGFQWAPGNEFPSVDLRWNNSDGLGHNHDWGDRELPFTKLANGDYFKDWGLASTSYYTDAVCEIRWSSVLNHKYQNDYGDYKAPYIRFSTDAKRTADIAQHKQDITGSQDAKDLRLPDLDDAVAKAKAKIDQNDGLTNQQKTDLKKKIDTAYNNAQDNVHKDFRASNVNSDVDGGVNTIDDLGNTPGVDIPGARKTAINDLTDEATKIKQKISDDNGLTSDQKKQEDGLVDTDLTTYTNKINADKKADDINNDESAGITKIDGDYTAGNLDALKAAKKSALDQTAQTVINKINADNTLTSTEKTNQVNQVTADKNAAETKIDNDTTADQVVSDANVDLSSDYKPGDSLDKQKGGCEGESGR
ncbi:DUF1542 domain-containing protein [Fructobacillus sp. M2-14]|uniref:DUF1542 domain-containing protein n=1 Tax=Fructobacillus broussonetiae TaxID=2713173 RepID=A0ABS5QZ88_9LACO|nr:DUF1542 domain-containing protein [Fructobacillus broussonetiae]MBS9338499.1 DUF1542 domain-containing protein [Fructobacillus broussonetiae]